MVRIIVEGPELDGFVVGEFTDHYVKCRFGESTRTYTVREWDANRRRLTLDFVVHGDAGIAGPWAATARPGDTLALTGPGGGYAPSPDVDWHLMVGDEAVIPAIAVSLDRINPGVPVFAILEVGGPEDEQPPQLPRRPAPAVAPPYPRPWRGPRPTVGGGPRARSSRGPWASIRPRRGRGRTARPPPPPPRARHPPKRPISDRILEAQTHRRAMARREARLDHPRPKPTTT